MSRHAHHHQRGAALVLAIVAVLIVTVIGVGSLRIGTREVASATSGARRQALVACADAARQLLVSQMHVLGLAPTELGSLDLPLDGTASGRERVVGGHINEDPGAASAADPAKTQVQITQLVPLPENAFGPVTSVRSNENRVPGPTRGAKPFKVVAHCIDGYDGTPTGGRQLEVEFGVRFGL